MDLVGACVTGTACIRFVVPSNVLFMLRIWCIPMLFCMRAFAWFEIGYYS